MKFKRIISVILMISILFTAIAPVSFAVNSTFGPGESTYRFDWKKLQQNDNYSGMTLHEAITISVDTPGIYKVSNMFGGNVSCPYVISRETSALGPLNSSTASPLPVATYMQNGEPSMDLAGYNKSSDYDRSTQ